jgi:MFS family permease
MTQPVTVESGGVSRWWILGLIHFSMLAFAVTLQMIPPILGTLINTLGMSHTQAGALMGLFTLPGIFLALPGGYLSDLMGTRRVGLMGLALMTTGTFVMIPLDPTFLYLGRILAGVGAAILVVVAPQIISQRFLGRELGLAMGFFNTAVPLGTILAFNVMGAMGESFGIWVVITSTGGLSFIGLTAFYLTFADEESSRSGGPSGSLSFSIRGLGKKIWIVALVWALFNISLLSFFTFGIDFFTSCGYDPKIAGFISSIPMIVSIILAPLAGLALDRFGWRIMPLFMGGILCGVSILLIFHDPLRALIWAIMLGVGVSIIPPVIFTLAGEVVPKDRIGLGFGLLSTIFNIGVFFGIPMIGSLRDIAGAYGPSFIVMALLAMATSAASLLLMKNR